MMNQMVGRRSESFDYGSDEEEDEDSSDDGSDGDEDLLQQQFWK